MSIPLDGDKIYEKWTSFVKEALSCLDTKNCTWIHLPGAGGFYDQDEFIMTIWECIRYSYISLMGDQKERDQIMKRWQNGKS